MGYGYFTLTITKGNGMNQAVEEHIKSLGGRFARKGDEYWLEIPGIRHPNELLSYLNESLGKCTGCYYSSPSEFRRRLMKYNAENIIHELWLAETRDSQIDV